MPSLAELINDFEQDDDVVHKRNEAVKGRYEELKLKVLELEARLEIKDVRGEKKDHLDKNITE